MKPIYTIYGGFAKLACGCSNNNCSSCKYQSDDVIYSGPNLTCSDIQTYDNLAVAIQKIDERLCALILQVYNLTTTTTTTILD